MPGRLVSSTFAALVLGCAACGNGSAPPPASASAAPPPAAAPQVVAPDAPVNGGLHRHDEVTDGNTATRFQRSRLLAHYSTLDGGSGFILDRTGQPFKAKLDGGKVMDLWSSHGPSTEMEYRSDDRSIWLRIDENGEVVLFQGPKQHFGVEVVADAFATSLR